MHNYRLSAVGAAALASTLVLGGCWGEGHGEAATVVTPPPVVQELQNARYQITAVDAVTGAPVADPLKVSFVGAATLKAADGSSLNNKSIQTSNGTAFVSA